jgi:hypothetical protein
MGYSTTNIENRAWGNKNIHGNITNESGVNCLAE